MTGGSRIKKIINGLKPEHVLYGLLIVALLLLAVNVVFSIAGFQWNYHSGMEWRFYFDTRKTFPYYFSFALMAIVMALVLAILLLTRHSSNTKNLWRALVFLFLVFGFDKFLGIHNRIREFTMSKMMWYDPNSLLHYTWTIPYIILIGIFLWYIRNDFRRLEDNTQRQFILAGAVFATGAIIVEFIGTRYFVFIHKKMDLILVLLRTLEDFLQMIGLIIFVHALYKIIHAELQEKKSGNNIN